jgi:hypothetical protein
MKSRFAIVAALTLLASGAAAQETERLGSGAPRESYRPGWTITPSLGVGEVYDDNVTLFGPTTAADVNNDYIATYFPSVNLHYAGKHTSFGGQYAGTFLDYRTFSGLNRWDQQLHVEMRRDETAQLKWYANAGAAWLPSTDLIDLGGIPYRKTGVQTNDAHLGVEYSFSARNSLAISASDQAIDFDRNADLTGAVLRGGNVFESLNEWRHRLNGRLAVGADYSFRRARVVGDNETFYLHSTEAAIDYELSSAWTLNGGGGVVYMVATGNTPSSVGPAYRISLARHRTGRVFHVGFQRSYIPSFGFGGTVQNQEASIGYRTPIFNSRHWYLDNAAVYRDDQPLSDLTHQLPLRSLRTYSTLGWQAESWVRIEGFYSRVQQSSLRPGGRLDRNRVGVQIVTSKPMRIE